jgi:O-antigen ligase
MDSVDDMDDIDKRKSMQSTSSMQSMWSPLSPLWPLFAALVFLVILDPAFIRPDSDDPLAVPLSGNLVRRLVLGTLYVAAAWGLWRQRDRLVQVLSHQTPMLLLCGFALASLLWSTAPRLTLVRATHFAGLLLLAWWATTSAADARRVVAFLRTLFPLTLLLSVAWVLLFPDVAVHADGGAWAGVFRHKSELGSSAVFAIAFWLPLLGSDRPGMRLRAAAVLALALFLLWRSDSVTEVLGAALVALLWIGVRVPGRAEIKLTLAPVLPLLGLFWFWNAQPLELDPFLQENLGRNTTLTGRTPLWDAILENVRLHPLLGEGYDAFWVAGNQRAEYLIQSVGWDAFTAHNGYLEVLNTLGLIGLGLLLWVAARALRQAWAAMHVDPARGEAVFLGLVWLLFSSQTKSVFCAGTSLGWVMFLVLCALAARFGATGAPQSAPTSARRRPSTSPSVAP